MAPAGLPLVQLSGKNLVVRPRGNMALPQPVAALDAAQPQSDWGAYPPATSAAAAAAPAYDYYSTAYPSSSAPAASYNSYATAQYYSGSYPGSSYVGYGSGGERHAHCCRGPCHTATPSSASCSTCHPGSPGRPPPRHRV
jgi:hypothetical protein